MNEARRTIRVLKRDYGKRVTIARYDYEETDDDTGVSKIVVKEKTVVRRALISSERMKRSFVYDLTYIASNKNFVYGGLIDSSQASVIVDTADLPEGFTINQNDYVVIGEVVWQVEEAFAHESGAFIGYDLKKATGVDNESQLELVD